MTSTTFFIIFIPILAVLLLAINLILAPHNPYQEKDSVFECGFHSFLGQNRTQFSVSFFIFALLFLLFDLEILLVYPYSVSGYTNDSYGLAIMMAFFVLLTLGFIFELGKNALTIDSRQTSSYNNVDIAGSHAFLGFTFSADSSSNSVQLHSCSDIADLNLLKSSPFGLEAVIPDFLPLFKQVMEMALNNQQATNDIHTLRLDINQINRDLNEIMWNTINSPCQYFKNMAYILDNTYRIVKPLTPAPFNSFHDALIDVIKAAFKIEYMITYWGYILTPEQQTMLEVMRDTVGHAREDVVTYYHYKFKIAQAYQQVVMSDLMREANELLKHNPFGKP